MGMRSPAADHKCCGHLMFVISVRAWPSGPRTSTSWRRCRALGDFDLACIRQDTHTSAASPMTEVVLMMTAHAHGGSFFGAGCGTSVGGAGDGGDGGGAGGGGALGGGQDWSAQHCGYGQFGFVEKASLSAARLGSLRAGVLRRPRRTCPHGHSTRSTIAIG